MSAPMVLFVLLADAVILVPLWVAVARPGISRLTRPVVACLGLASAWGVWVLVVVLRAPGWMMVTSVAVIGISSVALAVAIHLCTVEEGDDGGGGEDGGGARYRRPEAPTGGGNAEPAWWPEFERELTTYMAQRDRARRRKPAVPVR